MLSTAHNVKIIKKHIPNTNNCTYINCVSIDCVFTKESLFFFTHQKNIEAHFSEQNPKLGQIIKYKNIYNLFIKHQQSQKAHEDYGTYLKNLKQTLETVKNEMIKSKENNLVILKNACGIDKGSWPDALKIIFDIFRNTEINVFICTK